MTGGEPLTREQWAALFLDDNGDLIPAADNAAVPDRRVRFSTMSAFLEAVAPAQDVFGDPLAEFLTLTGGDFDQRLQLPDDMIDGRARLIQVEYTGFLPAGWSIEVGQNAPAFGRAGGAYYSVVLDADGMKRNVFELTDVGVLRVTA